MKNRQPTPGYEGRILITPENQESAPFYARVTMADNPIDEGTPMTAETFLKTATARMLGLDPQEAVPDDAFRLTATGIPGSLPEGVIRVIPLLSSLNHVEAGPLDEYTSNHIGTCTYTNSASYADSDISNRSPSEIYWGFMGEYTTSTQPLSEYLSGRYSYNFTKTQAYKLDHVTRTATLLADISNYQGISLGDYDRIFAVDNQYIYFAKHLAHVEGTNNFYGTIYKFDHSGNLVSSVTASGKSDWRFDTDSSCFSKLFSNFKGLIHTKNYIIILGTDGKKPTSSGSRNYYIAVISKISLKVVAARSGAGSGVHCSFMTDYDNDILILSVRGPDVAYDDLIIKQLSESGASTISPSDSSCYIKFGGKTYSFAGITCLYNHAGNSYFLLTLYNSSEAKEYYTVITDAEFVNLTSATSGNLTDYITISYISTEPLSLDIQNYDPIKDEFVTGGVQYAVYPAYIAADNPKSIKAGYAALPYFKVDDHYHFLRTYDNEIYQSDASIPMYKADRFVGVS